MSSSMEELYLPRRRGGGDSLLRRRQPLVVSGRGLGAGDVLVAMLGDRRLAAGGFMEQRELVHVVVFDRGQREVGVFQALGIVPDPLAGPPALPDEPGVDPYLLPSLDCALPLDAADGLDREAG